MPARRRVLWEDLLEHLEVYIVMSDPTHFEFSEKAGLYLTHQNMIDDLVSTFNREWGEAVAFIEQQLRANLRGPVDRELEPRRQHKLEACVQARLAVPGPIRSL